jgi:hypothetical protein
LADWKVVNLTETPWRRSPGLGTGTRPEAPDLWEQIGITVRLLEEGEMRAMHHAENDDPNVAYAWQKPTETVPYAGWLGT